MGAPGAPSVFRRVPGPHLRPFVSAIVGYEEHGAAMAAVGTASLDVPVIVTLAGSFRIALDRAPEAADRVTSFAAGLHPGFVAMASDGGAACVQLNFTPLGARLALGLPMHALASRLVPLADLGLADLTERLAAGPDWDTRLGFAETWATERSRGAAAPDPGVAAACRMLVHSAGRLRISTVGARLGWSRKRLAARFRDEIGVTPKALARILRFRRAERMAAAGRPDWADIAAACGYSDQSHLIREFRVLAGAPPAARRG